MAYTNYKIVQAPLDQAEAVVAASIADGWQPLGAPVMFWPQDKVVYQAMVKGQPDNFPGTITIDADATTGLLAAGSVQELAEQLAGRIKAVEDALTPP